MPFLGQQMRGERGRSQGLHQSVCVRVDACRKMVKEDRRKKGEEEGEGEGDSPSSVTWRKRNMSMGWAWPFLQTCQSDCAPNFCRSSLHRLRSNP